MKKGEIWLSELPSLKGHEQMGIRPVLLLAETESNISIVLPFTSNMQSLNFLNTIEINPSNKNGLKASSIVMVFQIRAIDKKRLKKKIGELEESALKKIDIILKDMLRL